MSSLNEYGIIPHNEQYKLADPEPAAWMVYTQDGQSAYVTDNPNDLVGAYRALPLYTTPPTRQPLTDEEIVDAVRDADLDWHAGWSLDDGALNRYVTLIRAVERAHGITGENK